MQRGPPMRSGDVARGLVWLALVAGYAAAVRRLGRPAKAPARERRHPALSWSDGLADPRHRPDPPGGA